MLGFRPLIMLVPRIIVRKEPRRVNSQHVGHRYQQVKGRLPDAALDVSYRPRGDVAQLREPFLGQPPLFPVFLKVLYKFLLILVHEPIIR